MTKINARMVVDTDGKTVSEKIGSLSDKEKDRGFNIRWNALMATNGDWTTALQNALDNYDHVYIPKGTFPHTMLTVTRFGATISGDGQVYGGSTLEYSGSGISIKVMGSVSFLTLKNIHFRGVPTVPTDYFNTGSIGIDITDGFTSIRTDNVRVEGFETLVNSNYNSYYNKFIDSRFEKAKICLNKFSMNNIEVKGSRFQRFHNAIVANGGNGPLIIEKSSFEIFNGSIVQSTGVEQGLVTFQDNYVETYDTYDLPTNFPNMVASGALPGKFGGNTLFTGPFGNLIIKNNELQIEGVFRITNLSSCDYLESKGNNIHLYNTGNNLDKMFAVTTLKSYYINDRLGNYTGTGGYSRTYNPTALTVSNPYNENYYYDCIQGKEILDTTRIYTPTLQNGWVNTSVSFYGGMKILVKKEGLYLQGSITGTARTGAVICTLPSNVRPFSQSANNQYCNLTSFADLGAGNQVRLRYVYSTGEFRLEGTPASAVDIALDGLVIPMQI